jgi:hypothetical protein
MHTSYVIALRGGSGRFHLRRRDSPDMLAHDQINPFLRGFVRELLDELLELRQITWQLPIAPRPNRHMTDSEVHSPRCLIVTQAMRVE